MIPEQESTNDTGFPTRRIDAAGLVVAIVVCFAAAAVGGWATTSSVDGWYAELNKPTWNPPNWIFGPVWTVLYLMMAIAVWLVWNRSGFRKSKIALGWFVFQLLLNVVWSVFFFGMHQPGFAFVEIIGLWLAIVMTMVVFFSHSRVSVLLLLPYLLWVTFAAFLNYTIWNLN